MSPMHVVDLLRAGTVDASLAATTWRLLDGGVPLIVAGSAGKDASTRFASALVSIDAGRPWVVLDVAETPLSTTRLAGLLKGGVTLALTCDAPNLQGALDLLAKTGLPEDAIRRLGLVATLDDIEGRRRCRVLHYLRPAERDGEGHVQRRPPAIISAWDPGSDAFEDYAWGVTPELADRVDRSQADLEDRRRDRASLLARLVREAGRADLERSIGDYLATEPPRVPAPAHERARPSPFRGGLLDSD
jgi:hypothetical protein